MQNIQIHINNSNKTQTGFTLVEIVVATAIFAIVVSSILTLFNYVLKINNQVQATRQVTQGSRNFTEALSREIRNGKISYTSTTNCDTAQYTKSQNQYLAMTSYTGEKLCFYLTAEGILMLDRETSGQTFSESMNPPNFTIDPATFAFIVRPSVNPYQSPIGVQPLVTVLAKFEVFKGGQFETVIPYQTTISSDVYDIPNINCGASCTSD